MTLPHSMCISSTSLLKSRFFFGAFKSRDANTCTLETLTVDVFCLSKTRICASVVRLNLPSCHAFTLRLSRDAVAPASGRAGLGTAPCVGADSSQRRAMRNSLRGFAQR